jgi:hypothetical protein
VVVVTPVEEASPGSIPTNVFHQIDNADLIIADLTGNRPAVVYELALAHALGVETILVGGSKTEMFYVSQIRFNRFDFRAAQAVSEDLNRMIDGWVKTPKKHRAVSNPFNDFYGAPLVDISAASGLAAGFYDNFARPILTDGVIVEALSDKETTRPLKGLLVLRPDSLAAEIPRVESDLRTSLDKSFPEEVRRGTPNQLFIRVGPKEGSRIPFFLIRDYVIDIPRTMFSMKLSHRLKRLKDRRAPDRVLDNMQHVLIECFFENLRKLIKDDRTIQAKEIAFHIGTPKELTRIIKKTRRR